MQERQRCELLGLHHANLETSVLLHHLVPEYWPSLKATVLGAGVLGLFLCLSLCLSLFLPFSFPL